MRAKRIHQATLLYARILKLTDNGRRMARAGTKQLSRDEHMRFDATRIILDAWEADGLIARADERCGSGRCSTIRVTERGKA